MENNKCAICGEDGIPGLVRGGGGRCQYHYNVAVFGKEWADTVKAGTKPRHVLRLIEKKATTWGETKKRYAITLNGIETTDVYHNMTGYRMSPGIPLPGEKASFLQLPECSISAIKAEIAKINREAKEAAKDELPS